MTHMNKIPCCCGIACFRLDFKINAKLLGLLLVNVRKRNVTHLSMKISAWKSTSAVLNKFSVQ